jgi:hypothetical protein
MPVRRIPPSVRSLTGRVAGTKCTGEAAFESTLERDLLLVLEFAPVVVAYEVQPVSIAYADETGRARTYTADVVIQRRQADGTVLPSLLCEVKYRANAKPAEPEARRALRRTLRAGRRYARERGWCFRLLTERDIRTPYLHNARFLLPFRTHSARAERLDRLQETLRAAAQGRGSLAAEALLALVVREGPCAAQTEYGWYVPALWHLLATGVLVADYAVPLTMQTPIVHPGAGTGAALTAGPRWLCDPGGARKRAAAPGAVR